MKQLIIDMLKSLGFSAQHIQTIQDNWDKENPSIDTKQIVVDFNTHQRSLFEQDPEIIKEIDKRATGREKDIAERMVKKIFGLTAEETKDKDFASIVEFAREKSAATGNKNLDDLQKQLLEKEIEIKRLKEEEIPSIKNQIDLDKKRLKIDRLIEQKAIALTKQLQEKNPNALRVPFETLLETSKIFIEREFDYDLDDSENIVLLDRKTKLKPKNEAGTGFLTVEDKFTNIWKANKFIAESNAGDTPPPPPPLKPGVVNKDEDEELMRRFPHLKKAEEHIDTLKQKSEPPK